MKGLPAVERVQQGSCCYFESLGGTEKVVVLKVRHVIGIHH